MWMLLQKYIQMWTLLLKKIFIPYFMNPWDVYDQWQLHQHTLNTTARTFWGVRPPS